MSKRKYKIVTNPLKGTHEVVQAERYEAVDGFFHFFATDEQSGKEMTVASFDQELAPQVILIDE